MNLIFSWMLAGCEAEPVIAPELRFVRGGVLVRGGESASAGVPAGTGAAGDGGEPLPGGWNLRVQPWSPGQSITFSDVSGIAPKLAECVSLGEVPLGDVSKLVASGGAAPDTDLAFSPDGTRLAVGTYLGEVLVIDVATGAARVRRTLGEGMIRRIAWSRDGQTVYAGEQTPDAMLRAMDAATLADRWTFRMADIVGSTAMPDGDDLYGIYTLPGVYGLDVLTDGTVIAAASHGYPDQSGKRLNQAVLVALSPDGAVLRRWPLEGSLDAVVMHPVVSDDGSVIALPVTRSADGDPPADLPIGGMAILETATFARRSNLVVEPLLPYFKNAYLWNAHDVDAKRDTVMLGFGDGRVVLAGLDGTQRTVLTPGTPVTAGEVPIAASVGHGFLHKDSAIFLTSGTNIPWGAAAPELRPPSPHPGENTLWAVGLDGAPRWSFHGPWAVQGISLGDDGRHLVMGAGERMSDNRRDLYGALIFDLDAPDRVGRGATGDERLLTACSTTGPVFFRQAMSVEGVLALAEVPFADDAGGISGAYRVVLFR